MKANWIVHILPRNCILNHVTEDRRKCRSDGKMRKTTQAATRWP